MSRERSAGSAERARLEDATDRDRRNRAGWPVEPDQLEGRHRGRRDSLSAGVMTPSFDRHGGYGRKVAAAGRIAGDDPPGVPSVWKNTVPIAASASGARGPKPARGAVFLDALEEQHVSGAPHRLGEEADRRAFLH